MNKKKFLFLAVLFIVVGSISSIGTYAIYKLTASGTATISTASFELSVNGSEISRSTQTFPLSGLTWTNSLGTQVATGKIAPGSTATLPLTIDVTGSSIDVDYMVKVEGFEGLTAVIDGTAGLTKTGTIAYSEQANAMRKQMNVVLTWSGASNDLDTKNSTDVNLKNRHETITIIVIAYQHLTSTPTITFPRSYSYGEVVYFDPTSDETVCTTSNHAAETCMTWRVIGSDTYNVNLQLDHNLVNKVAWNSSGSNAGGPVTLLTSLTSATSTWNNVEPLNYTYDTANSTNNYGILSCDDGICKTIKNNTETTIAGSVSTPVRARVITGEEVAAITRTQTNGNTIADSWSLANQDWFYFSESSKAIGTKSGGTGNKNLKWLIENTMLPESGLDSGSTSNSYGDDNYGYWTLSPYSSDSTYAFHVHRDGAMYGNSVDRTSHYGARPVITIPKSKIK